MKENEHIIKVISDEGISRIRAEYPYIIDINHQDQLKEYVGQYVVYQVLDHSNCSIYTGHSKNVYNRIHNHFYEDGVFYNTPRGACSISIICVTSYKELALQKENECIHHSFELLENMMRDPDKKSVSYIPLNKYATSVVRYSRNCPKRNKR